MLSLKYLFPIEEREFKSTSIIKGENKNIQKLANEIKNLKDFTSKREEILTMIWNMEEEIMGKDT